MSRVTLHRIERGEPSVTMGAYLNAMSALGLDLELATHVGGSTPIREPQVATAELPARICVAEYPQLRTLAWSIPGAVEVTPQEALDLYERGWRHVSSEAMEQPERELLAGLVRALGSGHLLV